MRRLGDIFKHIVGILICSSQITEIYVLCENDNHNCCFYTFSEGWLKLAKAAATFDGKNIQHCGIMQNSDRHTHFCLCYSPVVFTQRCEYI